MSTITENSRLTFGKHKGQPIKDIPISYLNWMVKNLWDSDFHLWALAAEAAIQKRIELGDKMMNKMEDSLSKQADQFLRSRGYDPSRL